MHFNLAAAVIASALVILYAPSSAIAVLSAKTAGTDPMTYQIPVAVPVVLVTLVLHVLVQRYYNKKEAAAGRLVAFDLAEIEAKKTKAVDTP